MYLMKLLNFLHYNPSEIIHLKNENINISSDITNYDNRYGLVYSIKGGFETYKEIYKTIAELSIHNTSIKYNTLYSSYFYQGNELFPTLENARTKIILFTRDDFSYIDNKTKFYIGKQIEIPDMGSCIDNIWNDGSDLNLSPLEYKIVDTLENRHEICYPRRKNTNILIQDNYKLLPEIKWYIIEFLLNRNIPTVLEYKIDEDKYEYYIYGKKLVGTTMFYTNDDVLTLNFMNIACYLDKCTIDEYAEQINNNLYEYFNKNLKIHNQWMILDFPSNDLIRKIYNSFDYGLNKRNEIQNNAIQIGNYLIYTDFEYYIQFSSTNNNNKYLIACLQRKPIINDQNQLQELIKTNDKCINNKMNKWFFKQNSQSYTIISSYDGKCLNFNGDILYWL